VVVGTIELLPSLSLLKDHPMEDTGAKAEAPAPDIGVGYKVTIIGKPQLGEAIVRFVGTTQFQTGTWVGIELDNAGMFFMLYAYLICSRWKE
jgi:hypothetical protein